MSQKKVLNLALLLFFFVRFQTVLAQISASQTVGCAPMQVQFTGVAGAVNPVWNLGGSVGTTTINNPNPYYYNPGTYLVTYNAIVNGNPVTYTLTILVSQAPNVFFSYVLPASRCAPLTATFSGGGGSPGSTYNWAFGDLTVNLNGGTSVTHMYTAAGSYSPVMTVLDAVTGCSVVAPPPSSGKINVSGLPFVNITSSAGFQSCTPPFTTNFTGTNSVSYSPLPGGLTNYSWQFLSGSPATSGAPSPANVTFGNGTHTVNLTVTDNNQCSNTASTVLSVIVPSLNVQIQPTMCVNSQNTASVFSTAQLVNLSISGAGTTQYTIASGVNAIINIAPISTGGLKSYTATINNGPNCAPSVITGTFFIEEIIPNFTIMPNTQRTSCQPSFVTTFTNLSTINSGSSLTFTWTSLVGTIANWNVPAYNNIIPTQTVNPNNSPQSFTMTQYSQSPYTVYQNFPSIIGLFAQSNSMAQCVSTFTTLFASDNLWRPNSLFDEDKNKGCGPLAVSFTNASTTNTIPNTPQGPFPNTVHAITGYTFFYGTSPTQSVAFTGSSFPPINFTYPTAGTYTPYMILRTADGCVDTSYTHTITVVNPPSVMATLPSSACAGQPVTINMTGSTASGQGSIDHWHVVTDNRYFSGCVNNPSPTFPFTHVGIHTISATAYQKGCSTTVTLPQTIQIKGPYGALRFTTNCNVNKKMVTFTVSLQDAQSATLNFGDGSPLVVIAGVVGGNASFVTTHTYAASGDYTVVLNSVNSLNFGCGAQSYSKVIKIRQPDANILYAGQPIPPPPAILGCSSINFSFTGTTSTDVQTSCGATGYIWNLITPNFTMPTIETGTYGLGYIIDPLPTPPIYYDPILKDQLTIAGIYTISLTVRDENGCKDTETKTFRISKVTPAFTLSPNPLCLSNGVVQLVNGTQSTLVSPEAVSNYTFDFGDGSPLVTSTNPAVSPTHTYLSANSPSQNFTVTSIVQSAQGCVGIQTLNLLVSNPAVNFGSTSGSYICLGVGQSTTIGFTASTGFQTYSLSYGDPPTFPIWQNLSSPTGMSHTYNSPGVYVATMVATDNNQCKGVQQVTLDIPGTPTAAITFSNDANKFCKIGTPTAFSTSSINVTPITGYYWILQGPGGFNASSVNSVVSTILTSSGIYTVNLIVGSKGCNSTKQAYVYVADPKLDLNIDKTTFCLGDTIHVTASNLSDVYGWQWFFGDFVPQVPVVATSQSAATTPTVAYPYTIYPSGGGNGKTQVAILYYGIEKTCPTTTLVDVTVIKLDGNFIQRDNIYKHCLGSTDIFNNTTLNPHNLNFRYNWDFGGLGNSTSSQPSFVFKDPGTFSVKLNITDVQYGCKGSAIKNMTILPLPSAKLTLQDSACRDALFLVKGSATPGVSGSVTGTIVGTKTTQVAPFIADNTFTTTMSAQASGVFSLNVTDENGCMNPTASDSVYIQQRAVVRQWDTTIIIGQTVTLNAYAGSNFKYNWGPVIKDLNCLNCFNPVSTTTDNVTYSVTVADIRPGCFETVGTYTVYVNPITSLDVPSAFTPNGDGTNDLIFPDGWGIKKLNYFKVFNRWGQLLFETTDYKNGWDGTFNGIPQNMETYVYQVSVLGYTNQTLTKSGTFKLIR